MMMNNMSDDFDEDKVVLLIGRTGSGEFSAWFDGSKSSLIEFLRENESFQSVDKLG